MNWFEDLFGSLSRPAFTKADMVHANLTFGDMSTFYNDDDARWYANAVGNKHDFCYGKMLNYQRGRKSFIGRAKHHAVNYPKHISKIVVDSWSEFKILFWDKDYPSVRFSLNNGKIQNIILTFQSIKKLTPSGSLAIPITLQYDSPDECTAIDIFSTNIYRDEITKIAIMSALVSSDMKRVNDIIMGKA